MSRSQIVLRIEPDINELGYPRKREVEPYPREMTSLVWPITWPTCATITIPARMTADEWDRFMEFWAITRKAVVR